MNRKSYPVSYQEYNRRTRYKISSKYRHNMKKNDNNQVEHTGLENDNIRVLNENDNRNNFNDVTDNIQLVNTHSEDHDVIQVNNMSDQEDSTLDMTDDELSETRDDQSLYYSHRSESEDEIDLENSNDRGHYQEDNDSINDSLPRDEMEVDEDIEENEPLYPGARLTMEESLLSILNFFLSENLSNVGLARLLELIEIHCPVPNKCKKTLYLFKKYFSPFEPPVQRHFYCSHCLSPLPTSTADCGVCIDKDKKTSYFLEVSVIHQLQKLYNRSDFFNQLQFKNNRQKKNINNFEDIYDGRIYKEKSEPGGPLSNVNNISFMWNTDGVSPFKSSKFQIWPLYLSINELPYHLRVRKENLILAGLWFGDEKPFPAYFLHNISRELNTLKAGVNFQVAQLQEPLFVQGHVLCGTCDIPAKSLFLSIQQHNGAYGCSKCKIYVERFVENRRVPVYKLQNSLHMRFQAETIQFGKLAVEIGAEHIFGVKAVSVLNEFEPNYIRNTVIDSMHCIYLGVVKALLKLWFSSKYSSCDWSLSPFISLVDTMLCSLTPPEFITRLPRSISEHLKYWKAHELKAWFYYYSLPILETIMVGDKQKYFQHFQLLVNGISLLNQSSISEEMVDHADQLLINFVNKFPELYSEQFMTANIHNLLHLCDTVRDTGPLFVSSCFLFEKMNGELSNLVTGTRFSGLQICSGLSYFMTIPKLLENIEPDSIVYDFIHRLTNAKKKYKSHRISLQLYAIGTVNKTDTVPDIVANALPPTIMESSNIKIFCRLMKSGILYTSESYLRMKQTNSSFVKYTVNRQIAYGRIYCFVQASNCNCSSFCNGNCDAKYYAVINNYYVMRKFTSEMTESSQIYECWPTDEIYTLDVQSLISVCLFIQIKSPRRQYIVEPINIEEAE